MLRQMGTQRVQMKGILPWLVRWALHAGTRDFFLSFLGCSSPPSTKYFFPRRALFISIQLSPSPTKLGRLPLTCLSGRNLYLLTVKMRYQWHAGTITVEYLSTVFTERLPVLGNTRQILDASSKSEQF